MPITSSATKHARQSAVRRAQRAPFRTGMKTAIRKVKDFAKAGKMTEANAALSNAFKLIDMAAKKNLIHWKNAARKKSLLSKLVGAKKKK